MRFGFIGIGAMGRPIATNILNAGHDLVVCDTNAVATDILAQRGATVAQTAKETASQADIVIYCLPNLVTANEVVFGTDGVLAGDRARAVVNFGTFGSPYSVETADAIAKSGRAFLDAPISGGPPGATAGTLGIMCSGDKETFDTMEPIFKVIAGKATYLGEKPGAAQTMKLVNNIISFGNLAIALEAMTLGAKAGLDAHQMIEVINSSSGRNTATEVKIPNHVLNRAFDYGAAMYIIEKDLELWRQEAELFDAPMWLGSNIRTLYRQCMTELGRDSDITDLARTLEKMAKVEISKAQ
ncbi:MAG: NAD(P)-dependent oxidoreductase [Rhodospirillales bacterium]|jgi:3-hydroxyisobutyrate dehydrogenase-like beta-hydroxyacid dehydrogenase|nr:NAD(P)-dependent oxidoreductase [Rhodospirillales bacterium]